jgi:putative FmdB family regulatory protein
VPIYEYRCSACGFQKEYLQKVSDPLLSVCPECSKETFGKMLTAAGFHLKGGGWYATDFKNSGAKPAAKQDKSQSKQDKSDTKQDKPEIKQDKPETKQDKPAEKAGKEAPKAESATGGGATPAS